MRAVEGPSAIEILDVQKRWPTRDRPVPALDAISLTVRTQEFLTLLGPSGCGKQSRS
jgi:ABC-type sugar transport system ATPase subunit